MTDKIVLYGAGERCEKLIEAIDGNNIKILAIIDADSQKNGKSIGGCTVESLDALSKYKNEKICITIAAWRVYVSIESLLIDSYGFSKENFVLYNTLFWEVLNNGLHLTSNIVDKRTFDNHKELPIYFGVIGGLVLGGVEERVKQLCMAMLAEEKHEVYIITNQEENRYDINPVLESRIVNVDVDYCEKKQTIINLAEVISNKCPCIVVSNQPDEFLLAAYLVKDERPDDIHIISIISGSSQYIYDQYLMLPLHSDLYIGVSEDIKRDFLNRGISNVTSMKVPFPCEEKITRSYSTDVNDPLRIGYAGRLDGFENSQKRMDLLLKMIYELDKMDVPFRFEIAGDGCAKEEMIESLKHNGLLNRVHFVGRVKKSEIQEFWKKQDIGVNVADYEGRSISIAEMMGGGAVPIVTDTSGVREDIRDGENGFIVPIGDYMLAAERIKQLHFHREKLEPMGRGAHDVIWPVSRMDNHLIFWDTVLKEIDK